MTTTTIAQRYEAEFNHAEKMGFNWATSLNKARDFILSDACGRQEVKSFNSVECRRITIDFVDGSLISFLPAPWTERGFVLQFQEKRV